jgi:hypothetical protein
MVSVACSVLRDPDRFSEGSDGLEPVCAQKYQPCALWKDCCSGLCDSTTGKCSPCDEAGSLCDPNQSKCCLGLSCEPQDAGPATCVLTNACDNAADKLALGNANVRTELARCSDACDALTTEAAIKACYIDCFSAAVGVSNNCANCYNLWWFLAGVCSDSTGLDCRFATSDQCSTCCAQYCDPPFAQCSGLPTP